MCRIRISRLKCCSSTSDGEKSGLNIFVWDPIISGFFYKGTLKDPEEELFSKDPEEELLARIFVAPRGTVWHPKSNPNP